MKLINGFPTFNNATDSEDSPVAAALALLFDYPIEVDARLYFNNYLYQRCNNAVYTVSRDQFISIAAVIFIKERENQALPDLVDTSRINGRDIMFSIGSHISICKGGSPSWIQAQIFKEQLKQAAKKPMDEQNQTFIQLMAHPDKALTKWYCEMNPKWHIAIRNWLHDRDEPELAELMISKIQNIIK